HCAASALAPPAEKVLVSNSPSTNFPSTGIISSLATSSPFRFAFSVNGKEIVLVTHNVDMQGGVNTYIQRWLWNLLENYNITVHVLMRKNGENYVYKELPTGKGKLIIHLLENNEQAWEQAIKNLKKYRNIKAIVTHSTWIDESVLAFKVAKKLGIARVAIYHASDDPKNFTNVPEVLSLASVIGVVFEGGIAVLKRNGYKHKKIRYVGPLPELDVFSPKDFMGSQNQFRRVKGIYDLRGKTIIFAPHSIVAGKGHLELLMALVALKQLGYNISVVISSGTKEEAYYKNLKEYSEENGLIYRTIAQKKDIDELRLINKGNSEDEEVDVVFIESGLSQEMLAKFYLSVDIMALPTYAEAFSLSLLEAMTMGVPVVATNVGGMPEAVKQGKTGILFGRGINKEGYWDKNIHSDNLTEALVTFLNMPTEKRTNMGIEAKNYVANNFSPQELIKNHATLIRKGINKIFSSSPLFSSLNKLYLTAGIFLFNLIYTAKAVAAHFITDKTGKIIAVLLEKGDSFGQVTIDYYKKLNMSFKPLWGLKGKAFELWQQVKGGNPAYNDMDKIDAGKTLDFSNVISQQPTIAPTLTTPVPTTIPDTTPLTPADTGLAERISNHIPEIIVAIAVAVILAYVGYRLWKWYKNRAEETNNPTPETKETQEPASTQEHSKQYPYYAYAGENQGNSFADAIVNGINKKNGRKNGASSPLFSSLNKLYLTAGIFLFNLIYTAKAVAAHFITDKSRNAIIKNAAVSLLSYSLAIYIPIKWVEPTVMGSLLILGSLVLVIKGLRNINNILEGKDVTQGGDVEEVLAGGYAGKEFNLADELKVPTEGDDFGQQRSFPIRGLPVPAEENSLNAIRIASSPINKLAASFLTSIRNLLEKHRYYLRKDGVSAYNKIKANGIENYRPQAPPSTSLISKVLKLLYREEEDRNEREVSGSWSEKGYEFGYSAEIERRGHQETRGVPVALAMQGSG
ncbi:MAG: glycosyltransferase family 4 protein, partial [Candidatus Aminicenantes bacterium]|nr:glycosyltransferase family 4 protein [Candidatus Aminicenantes bacterium]